MIKILTQKEDWTIDDYSKIFNKVDAVLTKRSDLFERYTRGSSDSSMMSEGDELNVPFEKFIVDLATGYLSGVPDYEVNIPAELDANVRNKIFGKEVLDETTINEMKSIIDYISQYNDDPSEIYKLTKDALLYGACYECMYENLDNEIVYTHLDGLNTVAIWDTSIPSNLKAIVSKYSDQDEDGNTFNLFRVIDSKGIRVYNRDNKNEITEQEDLKEEHEWGDVPGFAIEIDFSIIENSESVIQTYENLLTNIKNTYQYNDVDCKMKISGYKPQNRLTIKDPNDPSKTIINPDRIKEDEYVLQSKTFYTEEGGDASWLIKQVDAGGCTTLLKYYVDSIFQLAGIPNTADLAFNSADLNASAIDRKFYVMNMKTQDIVSEMKKALLRRFELIFNRINFKNNTKYDFRYIVIDIPKNLPSMTDETVDQMIKLNGILSEETVIEKLGYDYETEKARKEDEDGDNMDIDEEDITIEDEEVEEQPTKEDSKSDERDEITKEEPSTN